MDLSSIGVPDVCESPVPMAFCLPGRGGVIACPCGNPPLGSNRGCNDSAGTGCGMWAATHAADVERHGAFHEGRGRRA